MHNRERDALNVFAALLCVCACVGEAISSSISSHPPPRRALQPIATQGAGALLLRLRLRGGASVGGEGGGSEGKMWIMVHDVESEAVTLAWEKVEGAQCYEIQLKVLYIYK
jgi:hypothetical protein